MDIPYFFTKILLVLMGYLHCAAAKTVTHGDICVNFASRTLYLEPGTSALLYATNVTTAQQHYLRRSRRSDGSSNEEISDVNVLNFGNQWIPLSKLLFKNMPLKSYDAEVIDSSTSSQYAGSRYLSVSSASSNEPNENNKRNSRTATEPLDEKHPGFMKLPKPFSHLELLSKMSMSSESSAYQVMRDITPPITPLTTPTSLLPTISEVDRSKPIFKSPGMQKFLSVVKLTANNSNEEDIHSTLPAAEEYGCDVEIMTCSGCHLHFSFKEVHLPSCSHDKSCRCDYIQVREPPYLQQPDGGIDVCGEVSSLSNAGELLPQYTTLTKEATMNFYYRKRHEKAFAVQISALRNSFVISGDEGVEGHIQTPFFPALYPKDYWAEYIFININQTRKVQIIFEDFNMSPWSYIEVQDYQRSHNSGFSGNIFRPPPLVSYGSKLILRFSANGATARGFKFKYTFIQSDELQHPVSDCGGLVTTFGGSITMLNMTKGSTDPVLYDCVWIIQPPQDYAFKTHVFVRVDQFDNMGENSTLEVRRGLTSDEYLLEKLTQSNSKRDSHRGREHVIAFDTGFYVRLKGIFKPESQLSIVYSSFSYLGSCYPLTDFKCRNHRCIPKMLRCDGFDHCGDSSDEPESCYVPSISNGPSDDPQIPLNPQDPTWFYKHTPNYYFPYQRALIGDHAGSGILLLTSFVLLVFILIGLISFMIRQSPSDRTRGSHRRHRRAHRRNSLNDGVEIFDASADDPPNYEAPPDYEEVIKLILSAGNNLKLVRRPGGIAAWVSTSQDTIAQNPPVTANANDGNTEDLPTGTEDDVVEASEADAVGETSESVGAASVVGANESIFILPMTPASIRSFRDCTQQSSSTPRWNRKSKRRRHASLDLDRREEIVLWDPNQASTSRRPMSSMDSEYNDPGHYRYHPSTPPHLPSDLKRTSFQLPPDAYIEHQSSSDNPHIIVNVVNDQLTKADDSLSLDSFSDSVFTNYVENDDNSDDTGIVFTVDKPTDDDTASTIKIPSIRESNKVDDDSSEAFKTRPVIFSSYSIPDPCKKNFRKRTRKAATIIKKDVVAALPPSYESVLKQVLDEFYITDEAYVIEDLKTNIAAQLRVRAAREKFQTLCDSPSGPGNDLVRRSREIARNSSRKRYISPGTVKRRKAIFLQQNLPKVCNETLIDCENEADESNASFDQFGPALKEYELNCQDSTHGIQSQMTQENQNKVSICAEIPKETSISNSLEIDHDSETENYESIDNNCNEGVLSDNSFVSVEQTEFLLPEHFTSSSSLQQISEAYNNIRFGHLSRQDTESLGPNEHFTSSQYELLSDSYQEVNEAKSIFSSDGDICTTAYSGDGNEQEGHYEQLKDEKSQYEHDQQYTTCTSRNNVFTQSFEETI